MSDDERLFIRARATGHNDNGAGMEMQKIKVVTEEDMKKEEYVSKCAECAYARLVFSENGFHYSCMRSGKVAMDCMVHNYSRFEKRVFMSTLGEKR